MYDFLDSFCKYFQTRFKDRVNSFSFMIHELSLFDVSMFLVQYSKFLFMSSHMCFDSVIQILEVSFIFPDRFYEVFHRLNKFIPLQQNISKQIIIQGLSLKFYIYYFNFNLKLIFSWYSFVSVDTFFLIISFFSKYPLPHGSRPVFQIVS